MSNTEEIKETATGDLEQGEFKMKKKRGRPRKLTAKDEPVKVELKKEEKPAEPEVTKVEIKTEEVKEETPQEEVQEQEQEVVTIEAVEDYCKGVCDQADCVVISVEYHLAPEHPYPEGLEDSYLAVKWAVENKSELNLDENKIIVSGDSAGGNFSAVLTFMAKERKEFKIAKQI